MLSKKSLGAFLFAALVSQPASAGVISGVLSDWNAQADTCEDGQLDLKAVLNVAMFESINAIASKYTPYLPGPALRGSGSMDAAAATAAHDVLVALCSDRADAFDAALKKSLALIEDGAAKDAGAKLGSQAAAAVMASRADARAEVIDPVFEPTTAGRYVPTIEQVGVSIARIRPWIMTSADEVRSPPPPTLDSETWSRDFNEIKRIGGKKSETRTATQTDIGKFWGNRDVRIVLPQLVGRPGRELVDDARFLALAEMAWADSYISMMDGKYAFMLWRPITAIRHATMDGNDGTEADANWEPLLIRTPNHPEYPCGHCLSAGAVGGVIEAEFGPNAPSMVLQLEGALLRRYDTPREYVDDVTESRLLGGVHYRFSNDAGRTAGLAIGKLAAERHLTLIKQ